MINPLYLLLIHTLTAEAPTFETDVKYDHFKTGINNLVTIDQNITDASDDHLINPEVDSNILSVIQLFESRLRPNSKDGDCHPHNYKAGKNWVVKNDCRSVGNMQISLGAVTWLKNIEPGKWENITVDQLRDPETNTLAGYAILKSFKKSCKSSLPGVWLTAFGEGHCPKNNQLDYEGVRRCSVLTAQLKANDILPENWKCGHEGKKMTDKTALNFIKKIDEFKVNDFEVETASN